MNKKFAFIVVQNEPRNMEFIQPLPFYCWMQTKSLLAGQEQLVRSGS
ncbi:MAG: hypothetical protein GY834_09275 [Bacteroidetes bacterium]|nr:hypothetical protein [Bacteroidota bacterium]